MLVGTEVHQRALTRHNTRRGVFPVNPVPSHPGRYHHQHRGAFSQCCRSLAHFCTPPHLTAQVAATVEVTWVTPRILTPAQLQGLKERLDGWVGRVAAVAMALESESVGMLAAVNGGGAAAAVGVSA